MTGEFRSLAIFQYSFLPIAQMPGRTRNCSISISPGNPRLLPEYRQIISLPQDSYGVTLCTGGTSIKLTDTSGGSIAFAPAWVYLISSAWIIFAASQDIGKFPPIYQRRKLVDGWMDQVKTCSPLLRLHWANFQSLLKI